MKLCLKRHFFFWPTMDRMQTQFDLAEFNPTHCWQMSPECRMFISMLWYSFHLANSFPFTSLSESTMSCGGHIGCWIWTTRGMLLLKTTYHSCKVSVYNKQTKLVWWCLTPLLTIFRYIVGPWSYGSRIYNYLCNKCLSPLMLWVRISIRVRYTTLCDKVCQWLGIFMPYDQIYIWH
jgi:hypothetical protein